MFRRTAALAALALALAASLAATVISPAQAADPMLVVPDSPSGDVSVTATADPAVAPFLAVRLIRGTAPTAPYSGIDPAPVANAGGTVEVTVPTWGLHQSQSTFVLLGCATAEPDSCTTLLASRIRTVTQSLGASAAVELPDANPVFVPEDDVHVTAANDGGGVMQAYIVEWRDAPRQYQTLNVGVRSLFTTFPDAAESNTQLRARRCSALTSSSLYCEQVSSTPIKFIVKPNIWYLHDPDRGIPITVNPAWSGSTRKFETAIYTAGLPYALAWELRDTAGSLVAGPVTVGNAITRPDLTVEVNPGREAAGTLPDGDYTAILTATVSRGEVTKTAIVSRPIKISHNPPRQEARLLTAVRKVYPSVRPYVEHAAGLFRVDALPSMSQEHREGRFLLRDRYGRTVLTRVLDDPCTSGPRRCSSWHVWDVRDLRPLRPGTFRAELTYPDLWGRPTKKDLGPVYVMQKATARTPVTVSGASARVSRYLYRVRIPAKRGEVDPLASRAIDVLVRGTGPSTVRFECRVPSVSQKWQRNAWRAGATWDRACRLFGRNLDGRTVQIRAHGKGSGRFRVQQLRVVHEYGVWRMTK